MKTKKSLFFFLLLTSAIFAQSQSKKNEPVKITVAQLFAAKDIADILPGFPKNDFTVVSFRLTIIEKGKDPVEIKGGCTQLSPEMRAVVKSKPPGTKLFFEYIKGKLKNSNDNLSRQFPAASFILSEK